MCIKQAEANTWMLCYFSNQMCEIELQVGHLLHWLPDCLHIHSFNFLFLLGRIASSELYNLTRHSLQLQPYSATALFVNGPAMCELVHCPGCGELISESLPVSECFTCLSYVNVIAITYCLFWN